MQETVVPGRWDNTKRGLRVAIKGLIAFLGSGAVDQYVKGYLDQYTADAVIRLVLFAAVAFLVSTIIDVLEDVSGLSMLGIQPTDRKAGDAVLGTGIGAIKGELVNDTTPVAATEYVEKAA